MKQTIAAYLFVVTWVPQLAIAAVGSSNIGLSAIDERPIGKVEFAGFNPPSPLQDVSQAGASMTLPAYNSESDQVVTNLRFTRTRFNDSLAMPRFLDFSPAISYVHRFAGGDAWAAQASVGSPSDRPYGSARDISTHASVHYRWTVNDRSSWTVGLLHSNLRPTTTGLPRASISYTYQQKDRFGITAGLPFLSAWGRLDRFMAMGFYAPFSARAQLSYFIAGPIRAYLAYARESESYFRSDRSPTSGRMIFSEERAALGVSSPVSQQVLLDVSAGQAFSRKLSVMGRSPAPVPLAHLSPDFFVLARATLLLESPGAWRVR